ncbi:hypothetical protein [Cribrihabitans neustonicus]|uniref:hypothetical protein n=1 Tax=Cribrihabitans neustonicus TaxID=1429085 RepID=UPI003B5BAF17
MTALMTPGFALSLSPEKITLRARTEEGGWQDVGSTPFAAPDLPQALAALREQVSDGVMKNLRSIIVLPPEVVRYLTIETGEVADAERRTQAARALEGATPYPVADLAIVISADGGQTHIAAAAKETLAEADSFARAHGFTPVCFTADPEGTAFEQAPDFGQCAAEEPAAEAPPKDAQKDEATAPGDSAAPSPEPEEPAATLQAEAEAAPQAPGAGTMPAEAAETEDLPSAPEAGASPLPPAPSASDGAGKAGPGDTAGPVEAEIAPETPAAGAEQAGSHAAADQSGTAPEAGPEYRPDPGFTSRRGNPTEANAPDQPEAPRKAAAAAPAVPSAPELSAPGASQAPPAKAPDAVLPSPRQTGAIAGGRIGAAPAPAKPAAPAAATPVPPPSPVSAAKLLQAPSAKPARDTITAKHSAPSQPAPRFLPAAVRSLPRSRRLTLSVLALLAVAGAAAITLVAASGPEGAASSGTALKAELAEAPDTGKEGLPGTAAAGIGEEPPIAPQVGVLADQPDPGLRETGETLDGSGPDALQDSELAFEAESEEAAAPEDAEAAAVSRDAEQLALTRTAQYAATGIWQLAPEIAAPAAPAGPEAGSDGIFVGSIDNGELSQDAVALPPAESFAADTAPDPRASPAAAGATFELDSRGLVTPTPGGTLNPDGVMVYLGRPKAVPPQTPDRPDPAPETAAEAAARDRVLSQKRPRPRPDDLAETAERAQHGGLSRAELASLRPRPRPASRKPSDEDRLPATAQAVRSSQLPRARPANFANLVDRARRNGANETASAQVAAVPAAAAAPAPRIPSSASVARRATTGNALNLRKLNLIGVYGTPSDRRALVRLPSGRYKKVKVGDRIDGGRVIAIGESRLQYQKSGRNRTLEMPNG